MPPQILADQKAPPAGGGAPHYYVPPQIFRLWHMPVICFLPKKNILKFLKLKDKSIFVKDFFISTKVRLKKMEHLHQKVTFSWDPYFSMYLVRDINSSIYFHLSTNIFQRNLVLRLFWLCCEVHFEATLRFRKSSHSHTALFRSISLVDFQVRAPKIS